MVVNIIVRGRNPFQVKDCIQAVLDSTVDEKGVVHHQVLESDRNGRTPDDVKFDANSQSCFDLIIEKEINCGMDSVQNR